MSGLALCGRLVLSHVRRPALQEALALGIPRSAIPVLRQEATAQELRAAREHLDGMVQSFLSASL